MTYLIGAIVGIVSFYGGAWAVRYFLELRMLNDLVRRLPQAPEEWEAEWEREAAHEDMLWEIDRLDDERNRNDKS